MPEITIHLHPDLAEKLLAAGPDGARSQACGGRSIARSNRKDGASPSRRRAPARKPVSTVRLRAQMNGSPVSGMIQPPLVFWLAEFGDERERRAPFAQASPKRLSTVPGLWPALYVR